MAEDGTVNLPDSSGRFGEPLVVGGVVIPIEIDTTKAEQQLQEFRQRASETVESDSQSGSVPGAAAEDQSDLLAAILTQLVELNGKVNDLQTSVNAIADSGIVGGGD